MDMTVWVRVSPLHGVSRIQKVDFDSGTPDGIRGNPSFSKFLFHHYQIVIRVSPFFLIKYRYKYKYIRKNETVILNQYLF